MPNFALLRMAKARAISAYVSGLEYGSVFEASGENRIKSFSCKIALSYMWENTLFAGSPCTVEGNVGCIRIFEQRRTGRPGIQERPASFKDYGRRSSLILHYEFDYDRLLNKRLVLSRDDCCRMG